VALDVPERLLRDAVERGRGLARQGAGVAVERRVDLELEARVLAGLAGEPLERRDEPQVVEHARVDRVGHRAQLLERIAGEPADRHEALGEGRVAAVARGGGQLVRQRGERLRRGVVQLARDAGALVVLGADGEGGERPHALAVVLERVEEEVHRAAEPRDLGVGHRRRDHPGAEVAAPNAGGGRLQLADRAEREPTSSGLTRARGERAPR
jgi:hypothetical protein